ncbi:hypothetical protein M5689_008837 [Euphorbia peplus]|nr:hypothetical protein M5689_008837 [Euphorbia peplus]
MAATQEMRLTKKRFLLLNKTTEFDTYKKEEQLQPLNGSVSGYVALLARASHTPSLKLLIILLPQLPRLQKAPPPKKNLPLTPPPPPNHLPPP